MMAEPAYQLPPHLQVRPNPHLQSQRPVPASSATFSHSRSRTSSSSVFPTPPPASGPQMLHPKQQNPISRRTPSQGTFSSIASSGNGPFPNRQSTSSDLRRSTSSRSGLSQPSGYVALMRKQKATVWCDRAQHEDPRIVAAQRQAKARAAIEVSSGSGAAGRASTSGSGSLAGGNRVTAKIRHHGKANLVGYNPAENFGVGVGGVPMRLSASEVEGGDSDDEFDGTSTMHHHRTGSGRSSLGSARRGLTYSSRQSGASTGSGRWSAGNTPPNEQDRVDSLTDLAEETPVPDGHPRSKDYFGKPRDPNSDGDRSAGSGSSGEKADGLGELGGGSNAARLASNSLLKSTLAREKSTKNPEELRRRGSVDERTMTMTMSAGRLYIANPDADSD